jgi:copper chaperone CopZ
MKFAEYDGADKWVGWHNPAATPKEKQDMLQSLLNLKSQGIAIVPEGARVEAIEYKGRSSTNNLYTSIDEMLLKKIESTWFGTELLMQVQGKGGYSSSNIGFKVREDAIAQGVYLVFECFKQIHKYIENINGIASADIELSMTAARSISLEEAQVDNVYFSMGLKPTPKFFLNRGYKEDEFTVDTTVVPSAAKNANFGLKIDDLDKLFELYKDPK